MYYLAIVLLFTSCSDFNRDKNEVLPDLSSLGLTRAHEEIAASQMDFGVNIFKSIAKQKNMGNFLVSPFSLSLDLAMLAPGAEGKTYKELVKGLGFEGFTTSQIGEYYSAVIKDDSSDPETIFKTANATWINTGCVPKVKDTYVEEVESLYNASVKSMDFRKNNMKEIINQWGKEETQGYIDKVLNESPDPLATPLVLTNALFFDGKWSVPQFAPYTVVQRSFSNLNGTVSDIHFFSGQNVFYSEYNTAWDNVKEPAILVLSYGDSHFKMLIMLPPETESINSFVAGLSANDINRWMKNSRKQSELANNDERMTFYIPQFISDTTLGKIELVKSLKDMGISRIFTDGDFTKISDVPLPVDHVIQRAKIDVNKNGTTAAAVTIIDLGSTYYPQHSGREYDFVVDRPFVYAIVDNYQSILFMGMVTNLD